MQSTRSQAITKWRDASFGGALQKSSGLPWSQWPWSPSPLNAPYSGGQIVFKWEPQDETENGRVNLFALVEGDTASLNTLPNEDKVRMAAILVLCRLTGDNLMTACQAVVDAYQWQVRTPLITAPAPEPKRLKVGKLNKADRLPISFDDL